MIRPEIYSCAWLIVLVTSGCLQRDPEPIPEPPASTVNRVDTDDNRSGGDIVFVHGLGGDWKTTWTENPLNGSWPEWIATEFPQYGVWSLGYEASPTEWLGQAMPLQERATNILDRLNAEKIGDDGPVVFITHSLGGLVIKKAMQHARTMQNPDWTSIGTNTCGVVFLATPHQGSDYATYLDRLGKVLQCTEVVKDLKANASQLRDLDNWYRSNVVSPRVEHKVYYEKYPIHGLPLVVDENSANLGMTGVHAIPADADHISICKPKSKSDVIYKQVNSFINSRLTDWNESQHKPSMTFGTKQSDIDAYEARTQGPNADLEKIRLEDHLLDNEIIYRPNRELYKGCVGFLFYNEDAVRAEFHRTLGNFADEKEFYKNAIVDTTEIKHRLLKVGDSRDVKLLIPVGENREIVFAGYEPVVPSKKDAFKFIEEDGGIVAKQDGEHIVYTVRNSGIGSSGFLIFRPVVFVKKEFPVPTEKLVSVSGNVHTHGDNKEGGQASLVLKDGGTEIWRMRLGGQEEFNDPSDTTVSFNLDCRVPQNPQLEIELEESLDPKWINIRWRFNVSVTCAISDGRRIIFNKEGVEISTDGGPHPRTVSAGVTGRMER